MRDRLKITKMVRDPLADTMQFQGAMGRASDGRMRALDGQPLIFNVGSSGELLSTSVVDAIELLDIHHPLRRRGTP